MRQLFMSATSTVFSDGHARPCGQLNCPASRPDSPRYPIIFPSGSENLYSRPGSTSMEYKYCGVVLVMQSAQGAVSSGALDGTSPSTGCRVLSYGAFCRMLR